MRLIWFLLFVALLLAPLLAPISMRYFGVPLWAILLGSLVVFLAARRA